MRLYQVLCTALANSGVDTVFTVMGNGNQDILVELAEVHGLRFVHTRHEQNAVAMADGYARATGKIGLASVTQGPGLSNAATSLIAAARARSPVLVLAGATSIRDAYNPQYLDQDEFARVTAGAGVTLTHPATLGQRLTDAFRRLQAAEGPYVLSVPNDIQQAEMTPLDWVPPPVTPPTRPSDTAVATAVTALWNAQRPAIIAGHGAALSGAEGVLGRLATKLGAPIATTLRAKGMCSRHPMNLGVTGGLGEGRARPVLEQADLVLVAGSSLSQWSTHHGQILADTKVIHVDNRPEAFHAQTFADVPLHGDVRETLASLERQLEAQGHRRATWLDVPVATTRRPTPDFEDGDTCDPRRVMRVVNENLRDEDLVVVDGGHVNQIACQGLDVANPQAWEWSNDFGAIGQGLALSTGAALKQGRHVVHVTGDASFLMNVADLDSAARYGASLTVIVLNDGAVGQERHDLKNKGLPHHYGLIPSPDLALLARSFGATGVRVDSPDELHHLESVLAHREVGAVTVVDVRINPDVEASSSWEIAQHVTWGATPQ